MLKFSFSKRVDSAAVVSKTIEDFHGTILRAGKVDCPTRGLVHEKTGGKYTLGQLILIVDSIEDFKAASESAYRCANPTEAVRDKHATGFLWSKPHALHQPL